MMEAGDQSSSESCWFCPGGRAEWGRSGYTNNLQPLLWFPLPRGSGGDSCLSGCVSAGQAQTVEQGAGTLARDLPFGLEFQCCLTWVTEQSTLLRGEVRSTRYAKQWARGQCSANRSVQTRLHICLGDVKETTARNVCSVNALQGQHGHGQGFRIRPFRTFSAPSKLISILQNRT